MSPLEESLWIMNGSLETDTLAYAITLALMIIIPAFTAFCFRQSIKTLFYAIWSAITPKITIEELTEGQGPVELDGYAKSLGDTTLVSPLSGKTCLYYHYRIEQQMQGQAYWTVVDEQMEMVPIGISGGTRMLLPQWDKADLHMEPHIRFTTKEDQQANLPTGVQQYLERYTSDDDPGTIRRTNRRFRIVETIIEPSERLHLLGTAIGTEQLDLQFGKGSLFSPFFVSNRSQAQLYWQWRKDTLIRVALGCGMFILLGYFVHALADLNHLLTQNTEPDGNWSEPGNPTL